jgi:two-component system sensor histidine kinase YesM
MKLLSYLTNILRDLSMRRKLIVSYFLLIFIPLLIVGVFVYDSAALSIKQEVSKYMSETLQQVNKNIDNSLADLNRMASILSSGKQVQRVLQKDQKRPLDEFLSDDDAVSSKINEVVNMHTDIESLFIFSYNGEIYSYKGANSSILPDYNFTRTSWFTNMRSLNQSSIVLPTHVQDEVISEGHPRKVFTYIKEINDIETRKPIGCILFDMNTNIFKNILDNMNLTQYQEFLVIDNNKTILYHTDEKYISTQFRSDYISKLLKLKTGSMIEDIDGSPMLITYNTSAMTNWTVISIIPVSVLFKNITDLKFIIALTILLCILMAFFIAILLSRTITKPLSSLQAIMKKAESGQFDLSVPVKARDEIGELSLSFNHMLARINELVSTVYQTEILKKEAELNALQAQINPHFLYNTLQTIDVMAEREGVELISTICQSLAKIFRYSINRGREIVPLANEIQHVRNYVYIQKLRFGNKFEMEYAIEQELYEYQTIKLILQPLIENALFHGIENKKGSCTIKISARKLDDIIMLEVTDSGIGMARAQLDILRGSLNEEIIHAQDHGLDRRSIGLKNVNARIKLYFGEKYGIDIESELNVGTSIKVTFPAVLYNKNGDESVV